MKFLKINFDVGTNDSKNQSALTKLST